MTKHFILFSTSSVLYFTSCDIFCCDILFVCLWVFDDTVIDRVIRNLKVKCANIGTGCTWTGDLRDLEGISFYYYI